MQSDNATEPEQHRRAERRRRCRRARQPRRRLALLDLALEHLGGGRVGSELCAARLGCQKESAFSSRLFTRIWIVVAAKRPLLARAGVPGAALELQHHRPAKPVRQLRRRRLRRGRKIRVVLK